VRAELARYEHVLLRFDVRDTASGLELLIALKQPIPGVHEYIAPIHPRDIEHKNFPWHFQKYLYDCLHDYLVELFTRNPQQRDAV
jgi:hypothetical protein